MLRPDLVVSPPFQRKEALSLLNGRSVKIVTVGFADSLEAIYADIRRLAGAIGHPARGEAMNKRMEADLERLSQDRPGKGRIAAYSQRSEEHTSELTSPMRITYAVFWLKHQKLKRTHSPIMDAH